MALTLSEDGPPLSEDDLRRLEERLGAALPGDYRAFLLEHNGGRPEPDGFRWGAEGASYSDSSVDWFLPVEAAGAAADGEGAPRDGGAAASGGGLTTVSDYRRLYQSTEGRRRRPRVPADLLPVATDPGGNLVCLGLTGPRRGAVFFWDHEGEDPGRRGGEKNLHRVAASFSAFLGGLFAPDPDEQDVIISLSLRRYERLAALFDAGAASPDFILRYQQGMTLLEYSAHYHDPVLTELLLAKGAALRVEEAAALAERRGNRASLELLREHLGRGG